MQGEWTLVARVSGFRPFATMPPSSVNISCMKAFHSQSATRDSASRPCCLIAEDQALIAMALEDILEERDIAIAGPFSSCEQALAWLERHTPEFAIIDYKLRDGPCTRLVRALRGRGVPVIIYSGYPHGHDIPPELGGLPWLEKPTTRSDLLAVMAEVAPAVSDHIPTSAL
jgi:ActR/RegA family two-component response regulator